MLSIFTLTLHSHLQHHPGQYIDTYKIIFNCICDFYHICINSSLFHLFQPAKIKMASRGRGSGNPEVGQAAGKELMNSSLLMSNFLYA